MAALIHPDLREALEATGLPWSLDSGGKHLKLRLAGRMIAVISRGGNGTSREIKNRVADIRRVARQIKGA